MNIQKELSAIISAERVLTRRVDLAAYSTDASVYRIVPRAIVRPRDVEEVRNLLGFARREKLPLTFRAAGTSLSGQALGPGVIVDCTRHWRELQILDGGQRVRVGPGVIAGLVNRYLAFHGFKLGPDPASIDACTIGGVVANNSSGMCCGVEKNAYKMLESLKFILPSGTLVDSAAPDASGQLRAKEPVIWKGIAGLRDRVRANSILVERIRRKYRLKNTMGYSLNAFVDFEDPLEILWHLLIGSEGTLAFTVEAVFRNIPDLPHKSTGLLFFEDVRSACAAIAPLRESQAAAMELMDRMALKSVTGKPGVPDFVTSLPETASALLVEHQAATPDNLASLAAGLDSTLASLPVLRRTPVTRNPAEQAALWAVRKGIIPSVGALRRRGTALVTEDVVFPVETLADGVLGLQDLFRKHHYDDSVIFGHAKDGNLHFLLSQGTNNSGEVDQFSAFLDDLAQLVVRRFDGALKAEHGTGRNMAPFLETEWGPEACAIMRELKKLVDPEGILNPGVILNANPRVHVTDLKTMPEVDEEVDRCIECGFCEPKCPSRDLSVTPRQRILILREEARLRQEKREPEAKSLAAESTYEVIDTCATDSLCATACPVAIDTGRIVKNLRSSRHENFSEATANWMAGHFALAEAVLRGALRTGHAQAALIGHSALARITRAGSAVGLAAWSADMPRAARSLPVTSREGARALYFPTCITRVFGPFPGEPSVAELVVAVAARAGTPVWIPPKVKGTCCGMPFSSKGYKKASARCVNSAIERLWDWSRQGSLPVVLDTSPCAYTLKNCRDSLNEPNRKRFDSLRILDSIEFARDVVLPALPLRRKLRAVALHPVCSVQKMGLSGALRDIAVPCAEETFVPVEAGCCGFAGDRGFIHPELTEAATRAEAAEIIRQSFNGYFASSRTCEIGMTRATGRSWRSFWALLDEASR
ncbi:MAG TPA: FAD-binding and (Fe-S)-binding domain-containing protein [Acidobacteriota bacterium]|nr:FAD-binding and (Fe-S)-binding domain-containing protein [Acidobacteriota bacterium]